jgi:hypothetical protein
LTKNVDTGWAPKGNDVLASDIFTLWGMTDLGVDATDTYVLSMTDDDKRVRCLHRGHGGFGIAARDAGDNWVNAVNNNVGETENFVWVRGTQPTSFGLTASIRARIAPGRSTIITAILPSLQRPKLTILLGEY